MATLSKKEVNLTSLWTQHYFIALLNKILSTLQDEFSHSFFQKWFFKTADLVNEQSKLTSKVLD